MANDMPHTEAGNGEDKPEVDFYLQKRGSTWYVLKHASEAIYPASRDLRAAWWALPHATRAMAIAVGKETRTDV